MSAFITGFVLAYVRSWRLALPLTSIIPVIAIAGMVMNHYVTKYMEWVDFSRLYSSLPTTDITTPPPRFSSSHRQSLKHVADGGNVAEEVISTVRTAHAFGTQNILSRLYEGHAALAFQAEIKTAISVALPLSVFFFAAYASYALAFHYGTTLILQGHGGSKFFRLRG